MSVSGCTVLPCALDMHIKGARAALTMFSALNPRMACCCVQSQKVAKHLAEAGLHAEAVASVLLHLLQQPPVNLGVACVSASGHVPRHPLYALPLRRRVTQLGYPPVDGFRHAVPPPEKRVEVVARVHPAELPKH